MKFLAKTFQGLEPVLANELIQTGATEIKPLNRAVSFEGDLAVLYKANLLSRTALRILAPFYTFTAKNEFELYKKVDKFDWSTFLDNDTTFAIESTVFSNYFPHSKYVALKMKDAIVDQFRNRTGQRPSIDTEKPDVSFSIHIAHDAATISIDSSGDSLHKRGYRHTEHEAPINEVLAAGMIQLSGWDKLTDFYDPMCGSGTILIEAAMLANNIPAAINRKYFAFMNWRNYDSDLWLQIKDEAQSKTLQSETQFYASDISPSSVMITEETVKKMKLKNFNLEAKDISKTSARRNAGMIITNPPYDERLRPMNINELYNSIGSTLKHKYEGCDAWLISSNLEAIKNIGLKPSKKITLYNGSLECKYLKYELYRGSTKTKETN